MNDLNNFNVNNNTNNNSTSNDRPNLSENNNQYNHQTNQQDTTLPYNNNQSIPILNNVNQNPNVETLTITPDSSSVNNPPINVNTNDTKPSNNKGILIITLIIVAICLVTGGGYLVYKNFIAKESNNNNNGNELEKLAFNETNVQVEVGKVFPLEVTNLIEGETITWTSNDYNIATVDSSGMVTGVAIGNTTIKVETNKKRVAIVNVVVKEETNNAVEVTSIKITSLKKKIYVGETLKLSATILPANATDKKVYWSSSNNTIATIDSAGKIKALKIGTVTITGKTSNNKSFNITITVDKPVTSVKINESIKDISINTTQQYTTTISPSDATDKALTWSSSDVNVATVSSSGLVTTKNAGTATIRAKLSNGNVATVILNVTIPNSCFIMSGTKITGYSRIAACETIVMNIPGSLGATEIGISAFLDRKLTSVVIPYGVTNIGQLAFAENIIARVTIPNSVTSISKDAFYKNQLNSVTIPNGITIIEEGAFSFNQLTSVTIPNSVTSIKNLAFYNNQLTKVTISNSVTSIGVNAFSINKLTKITIPNSVTKIDTCAFYDNKILQDNAIIDNTSGAVTIGSGAFSNNGSDGKSIITPVYLR